MLGCFLRGKYQYTSFVISTNLQQRLGANFNARYKLIAYFESNYDKIYKRFSKSMGALGNAVNYMISGLNNAHKIQQVESFFASKDTREYSRSLNGSLEKAKVNAALIEREGSNMQKWARSKEQLR